MKKLELHPLCTFFPRMAGAEFDALKADIKANGLRHRIVIHKGMILDGGNRYAACQAVGVPPLTVEYNGSDPVAYVLSANLHRRHMTAGQQAAIVAAAADWSKAQKVGRPKQSGNVTGFPDQAVTLPLDTVAARAAQSGASEKTQRDADKVVRADPKLGKQVSTGEVSLADAKAQVTGKTRPSETKDDDSPTVGSIMDGLNAEIHALQAEVDALKVTDKDKELNKQMVLLKHAVREKDEQMDRASRLIKERDKLARWQGDVVRISKAGSPEKAMAWVKERAK